MALRPISELDAEQLLGTYTAGIRGLLVDWTDEARRKGVQIMHGSHGRQYAIIGGAAHPILCGDIVPVQTEDGPSDGRCGARATDEGACPFHAETQRQWRDLTPFEQAAFERAEEELR